MGYFPPSTLLLLSWETTLAAIDPILYVINRWDEEGVLIDSGTSEELLILCRLGTDTETPFQEDLPSFSTDTNFNKLHYQLHIFKDFSKCERKTAHPHHQELILFSILTIGNLLLMTNNKGELR